MITIDEIKKWKSTDVVTISAGTGMGKSYFIKNILYALAKKDNKKILMFIHRKNCVDQFTKEIEKDRKIDTITIKTYQYLENLYKNKQTFNFNEYEYIVCDEFHYFLSDASYNITTDISLNTILEQTNITRIFMSATGNYMKEYINDLKKIHTINYKLPIKYEFIKSLTFFNKPKTLEKFIEEAINNNNKAIFFIQSAKQAYNLYKKYENYCLFNCSKSNIKYYKYVDKEKINKMLEDEKFNELILITTTCLDAGVNIIDNNVKHIIISVEDIGSLLQCLGRKRIQNKNDKINIYIKTITNQQLGGKETQLKNKIKMANYLREHNVKEYIKKYPRKNDISNIVYDDIVNEDNKSTKKINELMYFKCKLDIKEIDAIKKYGEFGYCKYLANLFGYIDSNGYYKYRLIEEDWKQENLEKYLDSIVGKKLFKSEKEELINMIDLRDKRNRQQKSIEQFNSYFKANNLKYLIVNKKSGSKRYWEIINNII